MNARMAATLARAAITSKKAAVMPGRYPHGTGTGGDRHASRCLKFTEIDWDAPLAKVITKPKDPGGRGCPEDG